MTGGAFGSLVAQFLHLTADERKTLLVAGAAGGMAATFNTPLAAVVLAVELLLFEWRPRRFVPVVAAVAVATIVPRCPARTQRALPVAARVAAPRPPALKVLCVVAGVIAGVLALAATALVYASEDAFTGCRSTGCGGRRSAASSSASAACSSRRRWASDTTSSAASCAAVVGLCIWSSASSWSRR